MKTASSHSAKSPTTRREYRTVPVVLTLEGTGEVLAHFKITPGFSSAISRMALANHQTESEWVVEKLRNAFATKGIEAFKA